MTNEITNEITEPNYIQILSKILSLKTSQVETILNLTSEGATVPFIARYRKEATGSLDEVQIRNIIDESNKQITLHKSKTTAINGIHEQNKLTKELKEQIINSKTVTEVEDIYTPYKRKKKTKAQIAIEKGFDVIAKQIKEQENINIPKNLLKDNKEEEIISGACDIIVQELVDDTLNKKGMRFYYEKYGEIESQKIKKEKLDELNEKTKKQIHKFDIYQDFTADVQFIKAYQTLALNRGENLKILNIKIIKDEITQNNLEEKYITKTINIEPLKKCIKDAHKRLFTSIEKEIRNILTEKAELVSIKSFQDNLTQLLMTKPRYGEKVLGIDPGYRSGCKLAIINEDMLPVEFGKVFLDNKNNTINTLTNLTNKYKGIKIALGNGTASNEMYDLISKNLKLKVNLINEDGASVYSASEVAKEEFPNLDLTDRGTISIARRFIDPLAELVKIPVQNIGVGMYQHDMNEKLLVEKLGHVIEDVVNKVGINVNTSSAYLLKHISGLNIKSAKKIYENRPYKTRKSLKKVLSKKAYEQGVGFLRISDSSEELDNTNIHPEQYDIAKFIIKNKVKPVDFYKFEFKLKELYKDVNQTTIEDINQAYDNREDPRNNSGSLEIDEIKSIEDLKIGDIYQGIVRNVMQFGCFVDIGVKQNGLVHISELANKFVKDPNEVVSVGNNVKVKIIDVDIEKGKIQLSIKQCD